MCHRFFVRAKIIAFCRFRDYILPMRGMFTGEDFSKEHWLFKLGLRFIYGLMWTGIILAAIMVPVKWFILASQVGG